MLHPRLKSIIICPNINPGLTVTYFTIRSKVATKAFIWENVTIMYSLEIIAACDLEVGSCEAI